MSKGPTTYPGLYTGQRPWDDNIPARTYVNHNVAGCRGCKYLSNSHGIAWCNYLGITGISRVKIGAHLQPGGGCDLRETGPKPKKPPAPKRSNINKVRMELYNQGLSDTEIARRLDCPAGTIWNWRKIRNLPSNGKLGRPKKSP